MNFVMDDVLRIFLFSPVSIISPIIHTDLQPYAALTRRANRRINETFQKAIGEHGIEKYFHLFPFE